jgi:hypothetical protein
MHRSVDGPTRVGTCHRTLWTLCDNGGHATGQQDTSRQTPATYCSRTPSNESLYLRVRGLYGTEPLFFTAYQTHTATSRAGTSDAECNTEAGAERVHHLGSSGPQLLETLLLLRLLRLHARPSLLLPNNRLQQRRETRTWWSARHTRRRAATHGGKGDATTQRWQGKERAAHRTRKRVCTCVRASRGISKGHTSSLRRRMSCAFRAAARSRFFRSSLATSVTKRSASAAHTHDNTNVTVGSACVSE